jgi:hypothetical protein
MYTRKTMLNASGVTLHSAFHMPFNKTYCLLLDNENLDTLSKQYQQLHVVLIDEASLIGAKNIYQIYK